MRLRYKLHWANDEGPRPSFKWAIYDWAKDRCCPVAYTETRVDERALCAFMNARVRAASSDGHKDTKKEM